MTPKTDSPRLHILRAGTHTDMHGRAFTFTPEDLATLAASYDPALQQAPIVLGHPQHNSPAFGWIKSLSANGDDLEAELDGLDPAFVDAHREGRYRTRSASLYPPAHPGNPKPGGWYLRHLGFLGATPPAVKGLRGADLSDDTEGLHHFDFATPTPTEDNLMSADPTPSAPAVDFAAREAELAQREASITAREQAAAAQAAALHRAELTQFCDGLATEARIRPADVPALVTVLDALSASAPAAFADGEESPAAWLKGWLANIPPVVELGEVATKARVGEVAPTDDRTIVQRARQLHSAAQAAGAPISFAEAVETAERTGA